MKTLTASLLSIALFSSTASATFIQGSSGGAPTWPGYVYPQTINFDAQPTAIFNTTTIANVTFQGNDGPLTITPAYIGQYNTVGIKSLQSGQPTNPILPHIYEFIFTVPVNAFTFNYGAADNLWTMKVYDSFTNLIETDTIPLLTPSANNGEYFGAYAPDIKRVVMIDQLGDWPDGDHIFIDDFTYSVEEILPEPGSMSLLMLAGCASLLRRRR